MTTVTSGSFILELMNVYENEASKVYYYFKFNYNIMSSEREKKTISTESSNIHMHVMALTFAIVSRVEYFEGVIILSLILYVNCNNVLVFRQFQSHEMILKEFSRLVVNTDWHHRSVACSNFRKKLHKNARNSVHSIKNVPCTVPLTLKFSYCTDT